MVEKRRLNGEDDDRFRMLKCKRALQHRWSVRYDSVFCSLFSECFYGFLNVGFLCSGFRHLIPERDPTSEKFIENFFRGLVG
jgi:hypothetical protein